MFTKIRLQNFRLYKDREFMLAPGTNVIVGPNASGKTTLLEALYVLCSGKSYKGSDEELIRHGSAALLAAAVTSAGQERSVGIANEPHSYRPVKKYRFDGVSSARMLQKYLLPVVLFEPNDLRLLHGEPALRRDFLDMIAVDCEPHLQTVINHYKRALAQRNALLKQGRGSKHELFVWNLRLSELGERIARWRLELVAAINGQLAEKYGDIAQDGSAVAMHYRSKFDEHSYATQMLKKLESDTELDIARGFTSSGPHREDWQIVLNGQPAGQTASRGETRTIVLALKLIEASLVETARQQKPLLLLDDVFGELDINRRLALQTALSHLQIVITSTEVDITDDMPLSSSVIELL